jgi:WD40 repeat protein
VTNTPSVVPDVQVRPSADGATYHLAPSGDGRLLASVGSGDVIRIWNLANGRLIREVPGREGVVAVAFAPDHTTLVVSDDAGVSRFDARTGAELDPVELPEAAVDLAYQPDGTRLAAACADGVVRLVDGETTTDLVGHEGEVLAVAFAGDGTLASGGEDGTVRLWDTGEAAERLSIEADGSVFQVAFAPSGRYVLGVGTDVVQVWQAGDGELVCELSVDDVNAALFSGDGSRLLVASGGVVSLWETETWNELREVPAHEGDVWALAVVPGAGVFATGNAGAATVRLYEEDSGAAAGEFGGRTRRMWSLAFSPDGRLLATAADDGDPVRVWDVATGAVTHRLTGHTGQVYAVAFTADGKQLATADDDTVRLWDAATGEPVGTAGGDDIGPVLSVAFSPDGSLLATGGYDGRLQLWNLAGGSAAPRTLAAHKGPVWLVEFTADGSTLVSADHQTARRWDVATGKVTATLGALGGDMQDVAVARESGHLAVSSGAEGQERLRVYTPDRVVIADESIDGAAYALAFSPNGALLAVGGESQEVSLWDVAEGDIAEPVLGGHTGLVVDLAFSPDGRRLAVGGRNGAVHLWDIGSGTLAALLVSLDDGGGVAIREGLPEAPAGEYFTT